MQSHWPVLQTAGSRASQWPCPIYPGWSSQPKMLPSNSPQTPLVTLCLNLGNDTPFATIRHTSYVPPHSKPTVLSPSASSSHTMAIPCPWARQESGISWLSPYNLGSWKPHPLPLKISDPRIPSTSSSHFKYLVTRQTYEDRSSVVAMNNYEWLFKKKKSF